MEEFLFGLLVMFMNDGSRWDLFHSAVVRYLSSYITTFPGSYAYFTLLQVARVEQTCGLAWDKAISK